MKISFNHEGVAYTASASLVEKIYSIKDINPAHEGLTDLTIIQCPLEGLFTDEFARIAYNSAVEALG